MRRLNKKGIMIKFLTSLLLAIIVFAPACMIGSKVFRTSTQALENFEDFVVDIQEFAKQEKIGEKSSILLIMDEETAVVYFDSDSADSSKVTVFVDGAAPHANHYVYFNRPSQCELDSSCICLFRETDTVTDDSSFTVSNTITGDRVECSELDYNLEIETCSIGEENLVNSYECTDGFIIERNLIKELMNVGGYYERSRREMVYLTRLDTAIRLEVG